MEAKLRLDVTDKGTFGVQEALGGQLEGPSGAQERRNPKPDDNPLHLKGVCVKGMGLHEVSNVQIVRPPFPPRIHTTALGAKTHMNSAGEVKYKMQDFDKAVEAGHGVELF